MMTSGAKRENGFLNKWSAGTDGPREAWVKKMLRRRAKAKIARHSRRVGRMRA